MRLMTVLEHHRRHPKSHEPRDRSSDNVAVLSSFCSVTSALASSEQARPSMGLFAPRESLEWPRDWQVTEGTR